MGGGGGKGREALAVPVSRRFLEQKFFFDLQSENIKFLYVNSIRDFSSFIEQDMSDKK